MLSKRSFAAPVGLVAVFVLAGARAQTHALTILHHERLANLEFVGAKDGTAVHDDADAESVGAHKPAALREIELYRGRLDGAPSSWIRLSRHGAEISGAIWDGFDLYGIEPAKRVRAALVAPAAETGHEPIIFRYRDTTGALTDKLIVRPTDESEPVALRAFATLGSTLPDISQLDIGLVADFKFFEYVGGETTPAMLDAINVADGIFVEQVGLHLNVAAIVVHEEEEDPFSGRDGQELLRDLEAYKGGTPDLATLGLVHLFTARPLTPVGRPDGQTLIGLANFDAVCHPVYGTSLVDGRYQPSGLITAHEIAHVLGAPHDGEGDCVGTPATYLMAPILNYSHEFSQCSIQQMSNALGRAACLKALSPGQTEVAIRDDGLPNSVLLGDDILFGFTIENLGTETAFNVTVELDGVGVEPESLGWLPGFECETPLASFPWRCWAIAVRPSSSAGVIGGMIRAVATQPGTATLNATVSAANDTDRSNNAVQVEIEVIPAVELAFSEPEITASVLRPGQYAEASIVLTNRGRVDATNVDLHITDIHGNLELEPRVVGGSPCTVVAWKEWSCPIDILAAGDHRLIELGIHVREDVEVAPGEWFWASVGLFASAEQMHPGVSNGHWFRLPIARNVADIKVSVIPPADATKETETEASVVIENLGPDTAIDIHLSYYDTLARIDGADGIGTCEFFDPTLNCRIASLEPGQSATVTVRSRAPDESSSEIEVGAWTGSYDPEIANNEAAVQYPIKPSPSKEPPPAPPTPPAPSKPPQTSSGGGGGGAFDALTLMALAGLLMRHRARLRSDDRQKLARKPAQAR